MGELVLRGASAMVSNLPGMIASAAGQAAIQSFAAPGGEGPRQASLPVQTSTDGAAMPRLWGRMRLAGQIIWASRFREERIESGGKGGSRQTSYRYSVSFALGLCEGVISGIGRIWANGARLDAQALSYRVYQGTSDQAPDPLIEAVEGEDCPAFRDTAYLVFEDLPLDAFGGRIPNLVVEIYRQQSSETGLERLVSGVNLIPGSGEFALHDETVMEVLGPGRERPENRHAGRGQADLLGALNDLERDLPACRSVQLVVSWFGDDLRCGACQIQPGVEVRDKLTEPISWLVAGLDRGSARLLSAHDTRPAYGGTPSDASVIAAIRVLRARGYRVILYPFLLMDIPPGSGKPDPHGAAEQAAFPWRGRITVTDEHFGTRQADEDVASFFGSAAAQDFVISGESIAYSGPEEWGLKRQILHYAALARAAGGVDGFLIGSELVGLTGIRGEQSYPAVDQLVALAQQARALLGPGVRLSYAADWTEYSGVQDGAGEKHFHLDRLWSAPEIDAVAIDWYPPQSDWRAGSDHLDAQHWAAIDDPDYLRANIAGGEDHDWYYASLQDRTEQRRTQIIDAQYGESWVWRRKDLVSWWSSYHHDRPGGVRQEIPTGWVPGMKPIWLTEIGCPAIDKGSNQPNLFHDPKSSESAWPFGSDGRRDDMIQRRALEAQLRHWAATGAHNPVSNVYDGPMVEPGWVHVWCWDARPWPDFPARTDVWSDGENWTLGHWLNGRAGLVPVQQIIADICAQCGVENAQHFEVSDLVTGFLQAGPARGRDVLAELQMVLGISAAETATGLVFRSASHEPPWREIGDLGEVAIAEDGAVERADYPGPDMRPGRAEFSFIADTTDYSPGFVRAGSSASEQPVLQLSAGLVLDAERARSLAEDALDRARMIWPERSIQLPPRLLACEPGDVLIEKAHAWRITASEGLMTRQVQLHPFRTGPANRAGSLAQAETDTIVLPRPDLAVLDLAPDGLLVAAASQPWAGPRPVYAGSDTPDLQPFGEVIEAATMGVLMAGLTGGPMGRWMRGRTITLQLTRGVLASESEARVLNGANRLAIALGQDEWTICQFARAELIGPRTYLLTDLLFGLDGSRFDFFADAGAQIVLLDDALLALPVSDAQIASPLTIRVGEARWSEQRLIPMMRGRRPFAPVHLRLAQTPEHLQLRWIRRSRLGGDDWWREDIPLGETVERYRIELEQGEALIWRGESGRTEIEIARAALPVSGALRIRVCQVSELAGPGKWAVTDINL